ncbi:MAG TPA: pilus assembly protein TadG-related protein [Candidatus Cybelea sp.]|jgi:hypothetical protein|nr:pilus assembly protein TadG-related protein [Candidatus Cybelea sp.]
MLRGERGAVLPFVAIALTVVLGFAGMSIDVGFLEYRQQQQQNAADAAALGGAQALAHTSCTSPTAGYNAAITDAANNGYASQYVTVNTPPSSGPYANNACAVAVQITQAQRTFLSNLFHPGGMKETTQAVGTAVKTGPGCIYLLSMTQSSNLNGAHVVSPQCGIYINDSANFNSATVSALSIGYAGGAPNENGATFSVATPAPMLPVEDPCPEIVACEYLTNNPPSTTNCINYNGNGSSGPLAQGCYNNLNLNGANLTLAGLYVLNGSSNFNGAHLSGSGVTFYVTSSGTAPNFNGASISFTPPSTGNYPGVLYYQVPANSQSPNFNGTSSNLQGLIYAPTPTSVNFNGAGGGYLVLVFGAVNLNGSSTYDFATPPPNQSYIYRGALTQ